MRKCSFRNWIFILNVHMSPFKKFISMNKLPTLIFSFTTAVDACNNLWSWFLFCSVVCSSYASKKRRTPFRKSHNLHFGVRVSQRSAVYPGMAKMALLCQLSACSASFLIARQRQGPNWCAWRTRSTLKSPFGPRVKGSRWAISIRSADKLSTVPEYRWCRQKCFPWWTAFHESDSDPILRPEQGRVGLLDQCVHCECESWTRAFGTRKHWLPDTCKHVGVLPRFYERVRYVCSRPRVWSLSCIIHGLLADLPGNCPSLCETLFSNKQLWYWLRRRRTLRWHISAAAGTRQSPSLRQLPAWLTVKMRMTIYRRNASLVLPWTCSQIWPHSRSIFDCVSFSTGITMSTFIFSPFLCTTTTLRRFLTSPQTFSISCAFRRKML